MNDATLLKHIKLGLLGAMSAITVYTKELYSLESKYPQLKEIMNEVITSKSITIAKFNREMDNLIKKVETNE